MSLASERSTIIANARQIVDRAKSANRELTTAESDQVEAAISQVGELDRRKASGDLARKVIALGGVDHQLDPDSPGLFSESAKTGLVHAVKSRTAFRTDVDAKAALGSGSLVPTSGVGVEPGVAPTGVFPLSSLFRQEAAPGPVIRYYRMGAGTAAVVAEGEVKPDAGVTVTPVDLVLEKLACLSQFTTELAEDAPFLVAHLQAELGMAVAQAENARILATFAATSGILTGTGATTAVVDVVADAIAAAEAFSGTTPSAVVAHPNVVAAIRKSKASTAGSYMVDPTAPGPSTLHGVPLISTPATAAATAWVIEASGVTIFRRGPLSVQVGTTMTWHATRQRWWRRSESARRSPGPAR